ncbi:MAG: PAS domain S-box protein [Deltaproteobacteria bacterium]|nr:MAG: PAS domain S-box protein [Deltaproteobacteria bacterium]
MELLEEEKELLQRGGRLHSFHWFVLSLSVIVTILAWFFTKQQVDEKLKTRFKREAHHVVELVQERMKKYEDALWGGVALFHSQSFQMNYQKWKRYADNLKIEAKYPGINGIGVIYYVQPSNLKTFLASVKQEKPAFRIYPKHNKPEYWPITYIEPFKDNSQALGLDMAHEQNRHTAGKKSRDSGFAQLTGPIVLVQDSEKTPGFLFYAPMYRGPSQTSDARRKNFVGMVYAPFIMHKLMRGVLEKEKRLVAIRIRDEQTTLYSELVSGEKDVDPHPLFRKHVNVPMYGRVWSFEIVSTRSFRIAANNNQPLVILIAGIIIDTMLFVLFALLARSNRQVLRFAKKLEEGYEEKSASLLQAEALNQSILKNSVEGLLVTDQDGVILSFNPACETMFACSKEDALGQHISRFFGVPDALGELSGTRTSTGLEIKGKRTDGETFDLDLSISEITVDDNIYFSAVLRDITSRKQVERMKTEFVSTVNHELRTPLTSIQGALSLLQISATEQLDPNNLKLVELASRNCENLTTLVNDILDMEKIAAGKMMYKMQPVNLTELTEEVLQNHLSLADIYDVTFQTTLTDEVVTCELDPIRYNQALANLLSNAAKYSPKGGVVTIEVSKDEQGFACVSIADNGPGIPASFQDKIFGRFERADSSSTRSKGGSGLGLNITKSIIEAFHGSISFDSKEGQGSTFYMKLPLA